MDTQTVDEPMTAHSPFSDPEADLIILSSDGVPFHVYSVLLSLVSPVFGAMFKLPQGAPQELYDGKPFVPITDTASSLYLLLTWCDPRCTTQSSDLADLQVVLEKADKYGMDSVLKRVSNFMLCLKDGIAAEPLRVFAIARRFRLEELTKAAALEAIKMPSSEWKMCKELNHISAAAYHNLILYQRQCASTATQITSYLAWTGKSPMWRARFSAQCEDEYGYIIEDCRVVQRYEGEWLSWFVIFLVRASEAFGKRPAGDTLEMPDFLHKAYKVILDAKCSECRNFPPTTLHFFIKYLSAAVNEAIRSVELKLED